MQTCPMSWWPFKKSTPTAPEVTFISLLPHLEHMYPIYPSTDLRLPWMAESEREGHDRLKDISGNRPGGVSAMCSGIVGLHQRGWIVPSWCDIVIETNGDGVSFKSHSALPDRSFSNLPSGTPHPITYFAPEVYGGLPSSPIPPNALKTVIKFNLPWVVRMSPGWGLLTLPLEYVKEPRFTATIGVLTPRISHQINPILYWHVLKGQTLIKAGTPLMRVVAIPLANKFNLSVRSATEEERSFYTAQRLFVSSQYRRPHGVLGRFYDKMMAKFSSEEQAKRQSCD